MRIGWLNFPVDFQFIVKEVTNCCQALLAVEYEFVALGVDDEMHGWHIPSAKYGVDQSLAALRVPYVATLKTWLQIQLFALDPADYRFEVRVRLTKLQLGFQSESRCFEARW
ncbi:hypothetical protein A5638_02940 [Mycolicibacterium fortuitum]|nr:hypothetical protein A5638_02940 [Mycolicibacterium fortuitum]